MAMFSFSGTRAGDTGLRWNIFARTLEDVLWLHERTPLSRLDDLRERSGEELDPQDPESPRELVHREKVRRLTQSLNEPGALPILNRSDLERIYRYFQINDDERVRLQAAMLATHIQRMIYERIGSKRSAGQIVKAATIAMRAAESLLPTLMTALREAGAADEDSAFRETEGVVASMYDAALDDDRRVYEALAGALDAIDRGTLALNLSYSAPGSAERLERARAARDAFSDALERLDEQEAAVRASEVWRLWHDEARRGYDEADECVIDLGG